MQIINIFSNFFRKIKVPKFLKRVFFAIVIFSIVIAVVISLMGDKEFKGTLNDNRLINDVTGLNPVYVAKIVQPTSIEEIVTAISSTSGPISIGGGKFSQGGQTAYEDSLHLDMRKFNKILRVS